MSSRSNTEVIAVLHHSKAGCAPRAALLSVGTYQAGKKLEAGDRCGQGTPEDLGDLIDLGGADHQRWQEAHHAAMTPTQLQNQAALEAFTLHQRRQLAVDRRVALDIERAVRVHQFYAEHQPATANIAQLREIALQEAQVLRQALA